MSKKKSKRPLLLLLDAHAIIHRAYHALPDFATRSGVPTGAIFGFSTMILKIIDDFNPDHIVACYDLPGKTFRHEAFDLYKGTRQKTDSALKMQFDATREICKTFGIKMYDAPGFEADDVLGTICTQLKDEEIDIIIASGDMDTLQLVDGKRVQVYTLKRGLNDTVVYDYKAVVDRFGFEPIELIDYKGLRGDVSDNIPGIKGIGDKAATIAISNFHTIENLYKTLQKDEKKLLDVGLSKRMVELIKEGKEDAEFSKILATIRHDAPINFSVPEKSWREIIDPIVANSLFEKYELRALPGRLNACLNKGKETKISTEEQKVENKLIIDEKDLKKTALALWLLDSEFKEATLEDILYFSKEKDFGKASKVIFDELAKDPMSQKILDNIEIPLSKIINEMEHNGILVDKKMFKETSSNYHKKLAILEKEIHTLSEFEFNIRSPKQLSDVLFERLSISTKGIKKSSKTGIYSTNAQMLDKLEGQHDVIEKIIEFRELDKLVGTYIDVIPKMVKDDGRLHAQFVQNGTTTGRFSSKNPNMQNIPTRTELGRKIRQGFVARKGHKLVSFDYSQIELRCLAMLSGDKKLKDIFVKGSDIHTAVASLIGDVPEDEVTKDLRRKAKIVNFGILYGMGVNSLRKQMGGDRQEAQTFHDGYFIQFPEATKYLEYSKDFAHKNGYTKTLFGRRRSFKNINSKLPFIKAMAERMALNAPIQGTNADIIKLAMIDIDNYLETSKSKDRAKFILQIHDEIVFEVANDYVDEFCANAETLMQNVLENSYLNYSSPIPLLVHSSKGNHWGELK